LANYRLYRLDGAGKITTAEWVEADGDDDALEKARVRCKIGAFEVWERNRLVGRTDATSPPDQLPS
jgi:hypothetical protein